MKTPNEEYYASFLEGAVDPLLGRGEWYVRLNSDEHVRYYPCKNGHPNWFWRKMQFLILGLKWDKD